MPLIILTGYPSSGKSTRAKQLKELFEEKFNHDSYKGSRMAVEIISDESQGISKSAYDASIEEKKARGNIMSAVERLLSKNSITIVDSLNYIKGYRYQLYCVARSLGTTHCVIQLATPIDYSRKINEKRGVEGYTDKIFEELVSRYEEPNSASRWDSPLFVVMQHLDGEILPFDSIWEALVEKKAPPPNLATAIVKSLI
ncbi:Protein kti12 [Smittium culicis]|uniref:Protein kti12 n=1 Tax=Smittium culicis TaxID=133412 RepID=A0A1R1XSF8_9FUNG|nr:Protein kti12 [Smittium culicis]